MLLPSPIASPIATLEEEESPRGADDEVEVEGEAVEVEGEAVEVEGEAVEFEGEAAQRKL